MQNLTLTHVHPRLTPMRSQITGREVHVNYDPVRFCLGPAFSTGRLEAARREWAEVCDQHVIRVRDMQRAAQERDRKQQGKPNERDNRGRWPRPLVTPGRLRQAGITEGVQQLSAALFDCRDGDSFARVLDVAAEYAAARTGAWSDGSRPGRHRTRKAPAGRKGARVRPKSGEVARMAELLILLWKHELVVFPCGLFWDDGVIHSTSMPEPSERFYGAAAEFLAFGIEATKKQGRALASLFLMCSGMREIGDIDRAVLDGLAPHLPTHLNASWIRKNAYRKLETVQLVQAAWYRDRPDVLARVPQSYKGVFRQSNSRRADRAFAWAAEDGGERGAAWAEKIAAFVADRPNRVSLKSDIALLNHLLDYVLAEPSVAATPLEFCRRGRTPARSFLEYLRAANKKRKDATNGRSVVAAARFFDWLLHLDAADEEGVIDRAFRQPIDLDEAPGTTPSRGQTQRMAIPLRFLRMMEEIILSPDEHGNPTYAWAKSIEADWFHWIDPETGQMERVWSPVRAFFYLMRLKLPIRELQVRLLDSGEGDETVYRPEQATRENGGWVENTGPFAPRKGSRRDPQGLIRRIWDPELGRWFNGLFITTNKTQDRAKGFVESGYEIPWENREIMELACTLRDWQGKYNPCQRPLSRGELSDANLQTSADVAERVEKLHFLFRDAANRRQPQEPPTTGRLSLFWRALNAELERRLEREGIVNDDGSRVQLVTFSDTPNGYTYPTGTLFDPHSLRVAGLTALHQAGVPLHILSEFVAGHATVLMTLYYVRPTAGEVRRRLDEAQGKLPDMETDNLTAFLRSQPLELIHDLAVYNSEDGLQQLRETQSGFYGPMDVGICPNGGTLCHIGGPEIGKRNGKSTLYAPVPGGRRNCALCRFLITGPPWLGGLVAHFNATAGKLREQLRSLEGREARRRDLVKLSMDAQRAGAKGPSEKEILRADEAVQEATAELDVLWQTWMALLRLTKRSEEVLPELQARMAEGKNALVLNGELADLRVGFDPKATEFGLWDQICQSSEFYPSVDATLPALRRGRLYDVLLVREGRPAVFAALEDDQLVRVGNAASRFLHTLLRDRASLDEIMTGEKALEELGAMDDFASFLSRATGELAAVTVDLPANSQRMLAAGDPVPGGVA